MVLELPDEETIFKQRDVRETITNPKQIIKYYSKAGCSFTATNPDTDQIIIVNGASVGATVRTEANDINVITSVELPQNAIISSVRVIGNMAAQSRTWNMYRCAIGAAQDEMASALVGPADTTISYATINNITYSYYVKVSGLQINEDIQGLFIIYTTTSS